ncbi:hypothetical protein M758_UG064800 [Ceratodon purpureus]|nr:hypothetical protein M758_UG064800 [Ceratodon purpureus]
MLFYLSLRLLLFFQRIFLLILFIEILFWSDSGSPFKKDRVCSTSLCFDSSGIRVLCAAPLYGGPKEILWCHSTACKIRWCFPSMFTESGLQIPLHHVKEFSTAIPFEIDVFMQSQGEEGSRENPRGEGRPCEPQSLLPKAIARTLAVGPEGPRDLSWPLNPCGRGDPTAAAAHVVGGLRPPGHRFSRVRGVKVVALCPNHRDRPPRRFRSRRWILRDGRDPTIVQGPPLGR